MKQTTTIIAALFSILVFSSCRKNTIVGEGPIIEETRELGAFDAVQTDGDLEVVVYPSTTNKAVITGYHNLVPVFETDVVGGKLRLKYRDRYINVRHNNIKVVLYTTNISSFTINGSGKTIIKSGLKTDNMRFEINGSGDMDIEKNHFSTVHCKISGSGNINGQQCEADNAYMHISGSGNIEMTVHKTLDVKISGSGNVSYWGDATVTNTDISGSGKIKKRS